MSKIKNWMMDMEEQTDIAISSGASNEEEVLEYVKNKTPVFDSLFIRSRTRERLGEP